MSKIPVDPSAPADGAPAPPPVYTQQPGQDAGAAGAYYPPAGQAYAQPPQAQQYPPAGQLPPQQYPQIGPGHQQYPGPPAGQAPAVITAQPGRPSQPYPQNLRDWDTPLFGCCEDAAVCVYGYFCGWCMVCGIMQELGESQCYACLCPGQALKAARSKLRLTYGIQGSLFDDMWATVCCFSCAACQTKRQIKMHKTQQEAAGQLYGASA